MLCAGGRANAQTTTIANVGLTPGWATFGQAAPQGAAAAGLQVGSLPTQTDVKTRWPDGSIRFAVVTALVPTSGTFTVSSAAASTGAFTPASPSASVTLVIGGAVYTATLPHAATVDPWLSGPLASEGRFVVVPIAAAGGAAHPFLRVNFDTRVYNDGAGRLDVSVENVLDTAGATTVAYDVNVSLNGQTVFARSGVQHYYLTRWRKTFAIGTTTFAAISPDIAPLNTSKALPPYLPLVSNVVSAPAGPPYDILQGGALLRTMPQEGSRAELAPYPDWTARYLVYRDLTQRAFVLANGDLSGSWPIHMREPESGSTSGVGIERLVSIEQRPAIWLDDRAQAGAWDFIKGSPLPVRDAATPPGPGQSPLVPDNAHQPSLAYVPYLLTGDRYYAEEMAFWANYAMVRTDPRDGQRGAQGLLESNEVRGYGWALRNMVDAAAYYPDASPVKAYLSAKVTSNLQWLNAYANAQNTAVNPFQVLWINSRREGGQYISLWEQSYLAHAIDRAHQQGFAGGLAHRDAIARLQLKLFVSEPEYPRAQAAPYLLAIGTPSASNPATLGAFDTTMSAIWAGTAGQERPFAGFYGPEARLTLMYGVAGAWSGAQEAYDYLWSFLGVSAAPGALSDLAQRAGWAIGFSADSSGAAAPAAAQMIDPAPGSTLGTTQTFTWTTGTAVSAYKLDIGSAPGASDISSGVAGMNLDQTVGGLPSDGRTVWVRLWSSVGGAWQSFDYSYHAAAAAPSRTVAPAVMVTTVTSTLPEGIPDFSTDPTRPAIQSAQSGNWSSPATWQGGAIPTSNTVVRIGQSHRVTIADTTAVAYTIAVDGTLAFSPTVNTRLTVTNLEVMAGSDGMGIPGVLEVGTAAAPIVSTVTAEIVIADSPLGGGVADPDQFGTGILVFGKVSMAGNARTPTFVRLATEPHAGDTTLTLSQAVAGWRAGDRLVLPDTRHIKESEVTGIGSWVNLVNQWEERTLQSISADGLTLTLMSALQYDHLGGRDLNNVLELLPHVGNLTRNVIVRSANPSGTRGHMMSIHLADADIRYTLFKDLGRTTYLPLDVTTNHVGRYPIHIHHLSGPMVTPANGFQFTLLGNAVDGGSVETKFKWGIAVHGSHYGAVQDNVVYNYNGASIAAEDGSESFNVFDHNFALRGMGEPNDVLGEARMALGTEGVGFWFRGPNNYVRNNVAANFQNPTTEAAYGFAFQFRFLGNIAVPNFKGADTMTAGQFTTLNGNNLPLLQFDNNEAYGAMQGGMTYWWINSQDPLPFPVAAESIVRNFKAWHIYNKNVYIYPGQAVTFDGLKIRGEYTALSRCCGDGVFFADYMAKGIIIRNSDIQGMRYGITAPESGFGPEPNLTVQDSYLRNWVNVRVPTVASVNGCWMDDKMVVLSNTRFDVAPGQVDNHINMVRDVANAPECLTKLDQVRVYAYNGNAADNFQIYYPDATALPRPPAGCTPTTRTGILGLLCPIASLAIVPTVTLSAAPASIVVGQSATLTWSTADATTVSLDQGIGTVAASGTRSVSPAVNTTYTLTATGAIGAVTATASVAIRTIPTITWNTPPSLAYGTAVSAGQLTATASVPGTFVYSPAAGTLLGAGASWQLSVTFTPTDTVSYSTATSSTSVTVVKAAPVVTWATPADIVFGTPLGVAQLNASANLPGTFVYSPASGTIPAAGLAQTLSVTFSPTDTANYTTAAKTVSLNVTKATPQITWATPAPVTYPASVLAAQQNATADVPGAFVYSPAAGTALVAGTTILSVTFTPTNTASYVTTTKSVSLTVAKATPVITWTAPATITNPTALSGTQLNATVATPPGTLAYNPAAGVVLSVGAGQPLKVTFTPTDVANYNTATATVPITVVAPTGAGTAAPVKIGTTIAGTFKDATGHSGQSHLVYAPNARVWWLFTLSSLHDALGDRTVQSYVSSGPDLATATWTAKSVSPTLGNANGATDSILAGGRSLGVAVRSIGTTDYAHLFASAAFDGQASSNGHIRAQLGATSITWGGWDNPGSPNAASQWQGPVGTGGSGAAIHTPWGNAVAISTGGFVHHFSVTMDQEVDCAVGRSANADTAATWTNGFGANTDPSLTTQTSPPNTTAVIDKTMIHECKTLVFAPLASDVMLAVYHNGGTVPVVQPNLTNLRYQKSGAAGTWTNIPANNGGGNGDVFTTAVTIDQNDWALVPVNTSTIYAFRKNGTAINGNLYSTAGNNWAPMSVAPPPFGSGQAFKAGAGLFGASDGTNVWVFVVNGHASDAAQSILFTKFSGTTWTPWAPVPGTTSGSQVRNFITGHKTPGNNQIGLAWTQTNGTNFDVFATSLSVASGAPPSTATMTAPANGATVSGSTVTVSATATPGGGTIAGVQFTLDGVPLLAEDTVSPYSISWDTKTASNGTHFLSAIAQDTNGGIGPSSSNTTVTVTVNNDVTAPTVVMTAPAGGTTITRGTLVTVSANASDDVAVAGVQFLLDGASLGAEVTTPPYTTPWNTTAATTAAHTLAARARDAAGNLTTSASVSVAVKITPTIVWTNPAAIVYGTALGATQLNATANASGTNVPGAFVYTPAAGVVLASGTRTLSVAFTPTDPVTYTTAAASATISVTDTTLPTVTVGANAIVEATGPAGAAYFFGAAASDPVDGRVAVNCTPPSGTTFALNVITTVVCSAVDANGNSGSASFTVTVRDTTPPAVTPPTPISVPATEFGGARGNVTGSAGSQRLAAFLAAGAATDIGDAAPVRLAAQAVINGSLTDLATSTLFPRGTTAVVFRFRDASGNVGALASSITVTARIADEPTVVNTVGTGGGRLKLLQNPDGGWAFEVGSAVCGGAYGTCRNTFGIIALGLLDTDTRTGGTAMRAAAIAAGDALVSRYIVAITQTPIPLPFSQDIEFLVELAGLTGNSVYSVTARNWFQAAVDRFPNAADRIDNLLARRNAQGLRSVAAWDAASFIRAAKAVGNVNYALAAAFRAIALEPSWKDTNPAHRYDQCANPSGCGPADNPLAFDYTIMGEGSLLWAIHDLPGFDAQVSEYRAFLLAQQDPAGSWDSGDLQITAYVVIGLAAVGGAGTNAPIASAATFFLANQLSSGGWPAFVNAGGTGGEYGEINAEVVRALSTLFSTPAGTNVAVVPAQLATVTFSTVATSGLTTVVAINQATAPTVTGGFDVVGGLTYQVSTTAAISGNIVVCFSVPSITDQVAFNTMRILHGENGVLVDRTILAPDSPAPDFATRRICARTSSLSPFAVAVALPDTIAPIVSVPAAVTLEAAGPAGRPYSYTATAIDDVDGTIAAQCNPASGATFALGTTLVTCRATDAHGNIGSASFTVLVVDTTPPAVTVPANVIIDARAAAAYVFAASAADAVDGAVTPICTPPSGSRFAVRTTTTVFCRAADAHGNAASASFTVTVNPGPRPRDRQEALVQRRHDQSESQKGRPRARSRP